ncbi:hypothetical protein C456_01242 [Haloferax volcanii DSM 14919]|uniref:Uncharacterized protein n=1 Tax=Haloferax lucentense (strain DSM 14919 / JCM 9276 / NCIMB 13854 / Aa 2.2) TaxID=1230452 RepID=M0H717_HALL2|nr:hypothetical protein C456_01242 [Haloferax lucentense DSM 14919]
MIGTTSFHTTGQATVSSGFQPLVNISPITMQGLLKVSLKKETEGMTVMMGKQVWTT